MAPAGGNYRLTAQAAASTAPAARGGLRLACRAPSAGDRPEKGVGGGGEVAGAGAGA